MATTLLLQDGSKHRPAGATEDVYSSGRFGVKASGVLHSDFQVNGSIASKVILITATGAIPDNASKVLVQNGATNITLTLPSSATREGRSISISRMPGSTGSITLNPGAGSRVQALAGGMGATTTIGAHSAAGLGVNHLFWAYGGNWYR